METEFTVTSVLGILLVTSPVVLAGVLNMVFIKSPLLRSLGKPLDGGLKLGDGRRLFGDNKTWRGFLGMVTFSALLCALLGWTWERSDSMRSLSPIDFSQTSGLILGAVMGLAYIIAELPNSFLKRRIDIAPGTNGAGGMGILFTILDQADSVAGCIIAFHLFHPMNPLEMLTVLIIFSAVHYLVNIGLYFMKLKRQAG